MTYIQDAFSEQSDLDLCHPKMAASFDYGTVKVKPQIYH